MLYFEDSDRALKSLLAHNKSICFIDNSSISFRVKVFKDVYSVFFPIHLGERILDCIKSGKNTTFIPLNIHNNSESGHANILLFNFIGNNEIEIERYEPHGTYNNYTSFIDQYLKKLLIDEFPGYTIKYFSPLEYCPYFGAQKHSNDQVGYCIAFSSMYVFDRLTHPELTRNQVANMYIQKDPKELLKETISFYNILNNYPKSDIVETGNYPDNPDSYVFKGFFPSEAFLEHNSNKFVFIKGSKERRNDIEFSSTIPKEYTYQKMLNLQDTILDIQSEINTFKEYKLKGTGIRKYDVYVGNKLNKLVYQLEKLNNRIKKVQKDTENPELFGVEYKRLMEEKIRIKNQVSKMRSKNKFI